MSTTANTGAAALIVAAGRGTRLGAELPKQYVPLNGACALRRSIDLYLGVEGISQLCVVIHADDADLYADAVGSLCDPRLMSPVLGGATRAAPVRAGVEAFEGNAPEKILIHDAARPFMPREVIEVVITALDRSAGACAALPVVDALWDAEDGLAAEPVARDRLWRAQTPQGFRFAPILAAHRAHSGTGADDVAVAREAGMAVRFVTGSEAGYKITTGDDLARALRDTAH